MSDWRYTCLCLHLNSCYLRFLNWTDYLSILGIDFKVFSVIFFTLYHNGSNKCCLSTDVYIFLSVWLKMEIATCLAEDGSCYLSGWRWKLLPVWLKIEVATCLAEGGIFYLSGLRWKMAISLLFSFCGSLPSCWANRPIRTVIVTPMKYSSFDIPSGDRT